MLRDIRTLATLFVLIAFAACSSGAPPEPVAPAQPDAPGEPEADPVADEDEDPTTADGIFTVAQAERGAELFRNVCSECHDTVDWTDAGFRGRWQDESVFQLWYYINDRMPYDNPWSLSRQQVTDVLTYILELNGLPHGEAELATDDDSIDDYWIVWSATRPN